MKQIILATAAVLATTLLANLGVVKPAQANYLAEEHERIGLEDQNSNDGGGRDEIAVVFLIAGVGVAFKAAASRASVQTQCKPASRTAHFKRTGGDLPETIKGRVKVPLNPSDTSSYIERAYAHFKQGDRSRAIEDLNEAIRLNPHSAYLYSERANRKKNLGDKQGAIEDYTKAIRLNPHNALFYFWRSQTYHALGNEPRAIEDYNEAIRLAPEDTMYYCSRGARTQ